MEPHLPRKGDYLKRVTQEQFVLNWAMGMIKLVVERDRVYPEILEALDNVDLVSFSQGNDMKLTPKQTLGIFNFLKTKGLAVKTKKGLTIAIDPIKSDLNQLKTYENEIVSNSRVENKPSNNKPVPQKGIYICGKLCLDTNKREIQYDNTRPFKYRESGNASIKLLIDLMTSPTRSIKEKEIFKDRVLNRYNQLKSYAKGSEKYQEIKSKLADHMKSYMTGLRRLLVKAGAPRDLVVRDRRIVRLVETKIYPS